MLLDAFARTDLVMPAHLPRLRDEVRDFLAAERATGGYARTAAGWDRYDPAFSRKIAARGWIGMTWPQRYGGQERSALDRFVVAEELLAAGAPVRAHWLADRQIGPLLLSAGSEAQKQRFLPRIAAGECYFCVGLSEPDAGPDLTSIRTRADREDGGWVIRGRKVWTSYAHMAHYINVFARTSARQDSDRRAGVTQFIVDLHAPGVTVRPIVNLAQDHDFNEVTFDDVVVSDDAVIGTVGGAWRQVEAELAHERSGAERWLNAYGVLVALVDVMRAETAPARLAELGLLVARLATMHQMSLAIALLLEQGEVPATQAALIKDLGTVLDQDIPAIARRLVPEDARADLPADHPLHAFLKRALLYAPSHPIRGGTREILRGIVARGLGLR